MTADVILSKSERETLKALYRLTKAGSDAHTGALAEALGVSPGTATATVKRLADEISRDLHVKRSRILTIPNGVRYVPAEGARLRAAATTASSVVTMRNVSVPATISSTAARRERRATTPAPVSHLSGDRCR